MKTCTHCGAVHVFEKFCIPDEGRQTYRFEATKTWLGELGWSFSEGLREGEFCPTCTSNRKAGKHAAQ